MMTRQLVLCETSHQWTIALRWALSASKIPVDNSSSLEPCLQSLERNPYGVVGIEVALLGIEMTLQAIRDLRDAYPDCVIIALADRGDARYDALLREAGATHVAFSRRDLRSTARLVARCLSQTKQAPLSYRDDVWNRMPWA